MIAKGLEGVTAAETGISHIDGAKGHLVYRGQWAKDLALHHTFEEAAYLLWHGTLPTPDQLAELHEDLVQQRRLTPELRRLLDALPRSTPLMSALQCAVSSLAGDESAWPPTRWQALQLTALLPVITAYRYHQLSGTPWDEENHGEMGHAAHYLFLLFGRPATPAQIRAMNAYMVLAMEHGLNASTFAARVVASTESDIYSAVGAAIGAMKGPLHGGAPTGVIRLLDAIGAPDQAEPVLRAMLERGERLMGFGHRVYKTRDPRAEALRDVCAGLAGGDPWLDLAVHTERTAIRLLAEYKPGRELYTNVEFYAAAVMRAAGMPASLFTPTFTAARIVGWTAHVLEQAAGNRIYRPQSLYTGVMPSAT
ncbi:citrate/2-methylcitrate synthase [Paenibacillus sp. S-38]|uniref:citrate/2-methylcitrate synthase n=1 Tax=Paenibacillus sp. S-38 TaxID=3416710 RepID=UPI003CE81A55